MRPVAGFPFADCPCFPEIYQTRQASEGPGNTPFPGPFTEYGAHMLQGMKASDLPGSGKDAGETVMQETAGEQGKAAEGKGWIFIAKQQPKNHFRS